MAVSDSRFQVRLVNESSPKLPCTLIPKLDRKTHTHTRTLAAFLLDILLTEQRPITANSLLIITTIITLVL